MSSTHYQVVYDKVDGIPPQRQHQTDLFVSCSKPVDAPLIICLMTCSQSCDLVRRSDFVLRRRFFHFVKSWDKIKAKFVYRNI